MRKTIAIAALAIAMTGCAIPAYKLQNASLQPAYDRDLMQCRYQSKLAVRTPRAVSPNSIMADYDMDGQRKELTRDCMEIKGWGPVLPPDVYL